MSRPFLKSGMHRLTLAFDCGETGVDAERLESEAFKHFSQPGVKVVGDDSETTSFALLPNSSTLLSLKRVKVDRNSRKCR
jgi:hypothetical protein